MNLTIIWIDDHQKIIVKETQTRIVLVEHQTFAVHVLGRMIFTRFDIDSSDVVHLDHFNHLQNKVQHIKDYTEISWKFKQILACFLQVDEERIEVIKFFCNTVISVGMSIHHKPCCFKLSLFYDRD